MDKNEIKNRIKERLTEESAVGKKGRTGKADADLYVEENEGLVDQFKAMVKKVGGKAVALQLINKMKMGNLKVPGGPVEEARIGDEDALRFDKNLSINTDDFDDFVELDVVDVYPRYDGRNVIRLDVYKKGRPVILGYYYPEDEILTGEKKLIDMAFKSIRV
jgi:hypothetical protein